jgi:hypothetical protein
VTLTLSEGAKTNTTYAEIITTARRSIPPTEIGVKSIGMRKAVTGAIIIEVPGNKGREKALQLATHLTKVPDPTAVNVAAPTRTAQLKIAGIDISIEKEELRQALVLAAESGVAEIQVGEIGASRSGLGAAYVKCPVAGVRNLAQAGKVAFGWSTARVIAIPKRPLQCEKCLELGHVRATCVSTAERGHLCYKCGGSGHRARECLASAPRCPLCESLGAPANHRMGGTTCTPLKTRKKTPFREPVATERTQRCPATVVAATEATPAAAAVDGRRGAVELAQ